MFCVHLKRLSAEAPVSDRPSSCMTVPSFSMAWDVCEIVFGMVSLSTDQHRVFNDSCCKS